MQDKFDAKIRKALSLIDSTLPLTESEVALTDGVTRSQVLEVTTAIERMMILMYAIKKHASLNINSQYQMRAENPEQFVFDLHKVGQAERFIMTTIQSAIGHAMTQTDGVPFRAIFTRLLKAKQVLTFSDEERRIISSLLACLNDEEISLGEASDMMAKYHFRYEPILQNALFNEVLVASGAKPNMNDKEVILDILAYMIGHRNYGDKFDSLLVRANQLDSEPLDGVLLSMISQIYQRSHAAI